METNYCKEEHLMRLD